MRRRVRNASVKRGLSLLAAILLVAVGYRIYFHAPNPLPIYVILSEQSGFSDAETGEILASLGIDTRDRHVHLLEEASSAIVSDFDELSSLGEPSDLLADRVLLFLLQPPTSDSKKLLRQFIEKAFMGEDRAKALRRIVPVFTVVSSIIELDLPSATDANICDDFIYAQDNFGGIGLFVRDVDIDVLAQYRRALEACILVARFRSH